MQSSSNHLQHVPSQARGVVIFDLEQTLLAEPLASPLWQAAVGVGHDDSSKRAAQATARIKAARLLRARGTGELEAQVARARLVPGAAEAVALLQQAGVVCGLVSLGWEFAVEAAGRRLGIQHHLGTGWEPSGAVVHVWQEDADEFQQRLAARLGLPRSRSLLLRERVAMLRFARELLRRWR